ncbi:hypothetical protein GALMADRAFT_255681 [Galerina marginata CBS 339.88]|uniref:Uncharacterized protein n=1 Tax=Galerina marginata (strain CBS 339.88) TaxID=685588 RepID=A0A067SST1_GALM3|nr:hypothetical protein GALMADRAFT_255681 [Galerina marginata CBS 339.88]
MQCRSATLDPTVPALTPRHVKPTHHLRRPSRPVPPHQGGAHHVGVGYEEVTRRRTPDINTETNRVGRLGNHAPHLPRPPPRAPYPHVSGNSPPMCDNYEETRRWHTTPPSATMAVVPSTPTSTRNTLCRCRGTHAFK